MLDALLDQAVAEIQRREPKYFHRFRAEIGPLESMVQHYLALPLCQGWTESEVTACLEQSISYYSRHGVIFADQTDGMDPVTRVLLDSAIDVRAAEHGLLSLRAPIPMRSSIAETLAQEYEERSTPSGRYFIGRRGTRPLVLINAIGLTYEIWSKFLTDQSHPFRIILVESRTTDPARGGIRAQSDVATDADDIARVLKEEAISDPVIVGWCNGSRIAVQLAATEPNRIQSLVLLSPTLMGFPGIKPSCSAFEEKLNIVFNTIAKTPAMAPYFSHTLSARPELNWSRTNNALARASLLFCSPAQEHANAMLVPFSYASSLINCGRRVEADSRFPMYQALSSLRIPFLLITGHDDDIVSNQLTINALGELRHRVVHADISAAGHYIHDLQYSYFRWAIEHWASNSSVLPSTARICVTEFAGLRAKARYQEKASL
jgi:pimeloyl-ACP methyl ester carboxylesterase